MDLKIPLKNMYSGVKRLQFSRMLHSLSSALQKLVANPGLLIIVVLLGLGLLAWIGIPQFVIVDAFVILAVFGIVYVALNIEKDM